MPEKKIILTPPGCGLKRAIELFKTEYNASPLSTYLILPTERLAKTVKEKLLEEGLSVVEKAVTTPGKFAEDVAGKNTDFRLIKDEEAKMLLITVIKNNSRHIESISPSKEFSSRLLNDIYTLIKVLFERETDYADVFSKYDSKKNRALLAIIKDYETLLDSKKMIVPGAVYSAAADLLKNEKYFSRNSTLIFSGIYEPVNSLKNFITAAGDCAKLTVYFMPLCSDSRICSDDGKWFSADFSEKTEPSIYSSAYTGIFAGEELSKPPSKVYANRYKSIKTEITAIATEILSLLETGTHPSKIAVAFPDPAGATLIIDEIFSDFKIPYSSSATLPFSRSPVVMSVILITEVISKNFSRESVCELLSSPYIRTDISASLTDSVAGKAMIEDGFLSWNKNIEKYIKRQEAHLASPETPDYRKESIKKEINAAESVLNLLLPVLSRLNSLKKDDTYRGHIVNLLNLLEEWNVPYIDSDCGADIQKRDNDDLNRLSSLLRGLSGTSKISGEEPVSFYEFSRFFSSAVGTLRVPHMRDDSGVQVMGIGGLQDAEFDHVFIGGLIDGKIPDIPSLLPYTNDSEDQAIWPKKRREKIRWERFYFVSALCAAKHCVYLSCHDEADGRQEIPSQFYETAVKMLKAETPGYKEPCGSFSYSVAQTGRCLLKGEVYENFCLPEGISTHSVIDRINIEGFHRKGLYNSPFDGLLQGCEEITESLKKRFSENHAYSPTSLETYAGCPFRFYLKHVLGLNPPQEASFTLSPSDRGELIHRTLFSFYSEWRKTHKTAPLEKEKDAALSLLKTHAGEHIESYGMSGPAWDSMAKEILGKTGYGTGILEKFCSEEIKLNETGLVPEYFEAGFGFKGTETSFSDEPVRISSENGESILLKGFVDRIDSRANGDFVIVDYKTGSHPKLKDIAEGRALQIPLYLKAAESAKGMKGIGGFYYRISKRDVSRKAELYDETEEELFSNFKRSKMKEESFEDIIKRTVDFACRYAANIRQGIFTPAKDVSGCSQYCEFKTLCRFSEFRLLEQENTDETGGDVKC